MGFKQLCPTVPQNSVPKKYDISGNAYEDTDLPVVGEDIYGNRRAINGPLTGKSRTAVV